jgi:small-conductance mechanosensitive channel
MSKLVLTPKEEDINKMLEETKKEIEKGFEVYSYFVRTHKEDLIKSFPMLDYIYIEFRQWRLDISLSGRFNCHPDEVILALEEFCEGNSFKPPKIFITHFGEKGIRIITDFKHTTLKFSVSVNLSTEDTDCKLEFEDVKVKKLKSTCLKDNSIHYF